MTRYVLGGLRPAIENPDLSGLVASYRRARDEASAAAKHAPGDPELPRYFCRYCSKPRGRSFAGTQLDGHARCVVTLAFMSEVLAVVERGVALRPVWTVLGVSDKTLRAWCRAAIDERDRRRGERGALAGLEPMTRVLAALEAA